MLKRIFDVIASFLAILCFLFPWCVITLIIKIKSPGPVIFCARRIGLDGKIFTLYKFRTMCVNSGIVHSTTLRSDSRIFPFGAFLRKSKLDETPQLFNILLGDMSVIGPRPEDATNAEDVFQGKYRKILSVKPGLSSPASLYDYTHGEKYQTEEEYNRFFLPQKLDLELYYVEHRGNLYDLELIFRTIVVIFCVMMGKEDFNLPKEMKFFKVK